MSFARTMQRAKRRDLHRSLQAGRAKAPDLSYLNTGMSKSSAQGLMDLLNSPEMLAVRARMDVHAVYDRGDPVAEGRRGWMTHPAMEPDREDKGKRDGSCNRTACQDNLAGRPRWSMHDYMTGGRVYYCPTCADVFNRSDRQYREPERCSVHPGDEL